MALLCYEERNMYVGKITMNMEVERRGRLRRRWERLQGKKYFNRLYDPVD